MAVQAAEQALLVKRIRGERPTVHQRPQIAAEQRPIRVHAEQRERGRHDVDRGDARPHVDARRNAWTGDNPRHTHRRLIGQDRVRELVVFAQTLAVIGKHHDDRVAIVSRGAQLSSTRPTCASVKAISPSYGGRRNARDTEPADRRAHADRRNASRRRMDRRAARVKPSQRRVGHLVGASFGAPIERTALVKLLVEGVEALVESECRGHRVGADERRRAYSRGASIALPALDRSRRA